jgi:transposase
MAWMPQPLSLDLRRRILAAWKKQKLTTDEIAARFQVGSASVTRLKALFRETGSVEPRAHGGGRERLIGQAGEAKLEELVQCHPDWNESQFSEELQRLLRINASDVTVGRAIRRLGYSVKKRRSSRRKGTGRTSRNVDDDGQSTSETSPLRVWFLWTKRALTYR